MLRSKSSPMGVSAPATLKVKAEELVQPAGREEGLRLKDINARIVLIAEDAASAQAFIDTINFLSRYDITSITMQGFKDQLTEKERKMAKALLKIPTIDPNDHLGAPRGRDRC